VVAPGDQVKLVPAGDALNVETGTGAKIGHVEAKIARRVLKFIEGGNEYTAAVATADIMKKPKKSSIGRVNRSLLPDKADGRA